MYEIGSKVWIKIHRRSDKSSRLTTKIHVVYDRPYKVKEEIKTNAYLIEDDIGRVIGVYNSRQLRPHRKPKYRYVACLDEIGDEEDSDFTDTEDCMQAEREPVDQQRPDIHSNAQYSRNIKKIQKPQKVQENKKKRYSLTGKVQRRVPRRSRTYSR